MRRRTPWAAVASAALIGAAAVGAAWAVTSDGEDAPARPAVPDRAGLRYVGAALDGGTARTVDCRGRAPARDSPACTTLQAEMPGATLVVPENGVIRHWAVRGARGELTLSVLRPRNERVFQVTNSQTELVGSAEFHAFDAEIDVERGDRVALAVGPGSAIGTRPAPEGAALSRWLPPVKGLENPERGTEPRLTQELLLRVGIEPGATRGTPPQVTGSEAAGLPEGRTLRRTPVKNAKPPGEARIVRLGDEFAIDRFERGRRNARIALPEMRPDADVTMFFAEAYGEDTGLGLYFVNAESGRVVQRIYILNRDGFQLIR